MTTPPVALRYMTRFRCLADRCEDTCCSGLRIPVTQERWERLQQLAQGEDAELVRQHVLPSPIPNPLEHAFIHPRPDGYCPFLDAKRLCLLHNRYGEAILADPCLTFPRSFTHWGSQLEVSGTLGCPEVARLVLLAEDAFEKVPAPTELLMRPETGRHFGAEVAADAEVFRSAVLRLLSRREYSYSSRLALLAWLAFQVDTLFRELEPLQGEARTAARARLAEEVQRFESSDVLEPLQRDFMGLSLPGVPDVELYISVLKGRLEFTNNARFSHFVNTVLESYAAGGKTPEEAWRAHVERGERLERAYGARVHQYFLHHALNHWTRVVVTGAPGPLSAVFRFVLRVALIRWSLLNHPEVVALCAQTSPSPEQAQARLDAAAVECFQLVSKHVEHAPNFLGLADSRAGTGGTETLGKTLEFAKLCGV